MKRGVLLAVAVLLTLAPAVRANPTPETRDESDWESQMLAAGWTQIAWAEEGGAMFEYTSNNGTVVVAWWDNGPMSEVISGP